MELFEDGDVYPFEGRDLEELEQTLDEIVLFIDVLEDHRANLELENGILLELGKKQGDGFGLGNDDFAENHPDLRHFVVGIERVQDTVKDFSPDSVGFSIPTRDCVLDDIQCVVQIV